MTTLSDLLAEHTQLSGKAANHLQTVVAEWQLLADLSFADILMWVRASEQDDYLCVAHARPTTAPTAHQEDVVGSVMSADEHSQLYRAMRDVRICREEDPHWYHDVPMRREAIPVVVDDEVVAVLSRETNLAAARVPSPLEISYLGSAADLCQMIADGTFPVPAPATDMHTSPRVGDGFIRLDSTGAVVFASPNALSAYHRMGLAADLGGELLAPLTRSLIADPFDATEVSHLILGALEGQPGARIEAESRRGASLLFRALPLRPKGRPAGALVLVRDVTEVKRRDRALLSKDATIREIHHRVKNNLQTVAALLRLQFRRTSYPEAREALGESVRRVASIAMVHEALSISVDERVDLDELLGKILPMVGETSGSGNNVRLTTTGTFGVVSAELATPLVMVLTELVQNAHQHAYADGLRGEVSLHAERSAKWLDVVISDDGKGLPAGFSLERTEGLGLQIVRTLVESELRGSLSLRPRERDDGEVMGTAAELRVPLTGSR